MRFGFVGTLVWYKGGETLIRAMQQLAGESSVLNVYGGFNPDGDEHHAHLAELAGDNVVFQGRFDNSRLAEVYADIDVLIVPSVWYENSPVTIHEAYLCGTPVIASDIGGMEEYVRDGVDGLLFRTGDADSLAGVLQRFIEEPELAAALSQDFMPIKTLDQNGAETEFRYRALCCLDRSAIHGPQLLLEHAGNQFVDQRGEALKQGTDMLILQPGAAVDYDLSGLPAGPVQLILDVLALGVEPDLPHGARLSIDGTALGTMLRFTSSGCDELRTIVLDGDLPEGARRLQLDTAEAFGSDDCFLRVKRVAVRTRPKTLRR